MPFKAIARIQFKKRLTILKATTITKAWRENLSLDFSLEVKMIVLLLVKA
ncbi:hypothetical protein PAP18089_04359 [Pandoraea apista]|uniref:Uncharacterized protein n=1 Tax=Pandoraea apista TaxID=93218 RepID=A0A5E5PAM1_9BURK|nr:hypothetical protein PAP18089_04359 [Pandoraea apista]